MAAGVDGPAGRRQLLRVALPRMRSGAAVLIDLGTPLGSEVRHLRLDRVAWFVERSDDMRNLRRGRYEP